MKTASSLGKAPFLVTLRKLELTLSMALVVYMMRTALRHSYRAARRVRTVFSHTLTAPRISLPVGLELLEFLTGLLDVDGTIDELQPLRECTPLLAWDVAMELRMRCTMQR